MRSRVRHALKPIHFQAYRKLAQPSAAHIKVSSSAMTRGCAAHCHIAASAFGAPAEEVTEDDIERAIAEIQSAIKKVPR